MQLRAKTGSKYQSCINLGEERLCWRSGSVVNMENVKEKMSTAWEVTKEQVKNIWRFKCWQDEYSWSVKYLGCSCRRVGEGDGLGREGASCRSVRRILQSSEGFGGERAHHHGEDQDEDLWDLGGHQGAGLKQITSYILSWMSMNCQTFRLLKCWSRWRRRW